MFDVAIIGGGLAGLNCAYKLRHLNVLLLEKRDVGGRIYTHHDAHMVVEAGGARFNERHVRLWKLLREFHLASKITPLPTADPVYRGMNSSATYGDVRRVLDAILQSPKRPSIHHTFLQHAALIVDKADLALLKKGFGYTAELTIMNARDALELIRTLETPFFILKGGLSQLVQKMAKKVKHIVHEQVLDVSYNQVFEIKTAATTYTSRICICAVQKPNLEHFTVAKPLFSKLQYIKSAPLCRIYANARVPKVYTDSDLKMVIPMSDTVALFYTDSEYAEKWKKIKDSGDAAVSARLRTLLAELDLKTPVSNVKMFYWPNGVGYWGVGADSRKLERELLHPFKIPFFICGENYSAKHQQWMEGALDTSDKVVGMVLKRQTKRHLRRKIIKGTVRLIEVGRDGNNFDEILHVFK
jgi:monoamine oxidase